MSKTEDEMSAELAERERLKEEDATVKEELVVLPPSQSMMERAVGIFGGPAEFNAAMAIFTPAILSVLQDQMTNQNAIVGAFQLGTGALMTVANFSFFKSGDETAYSKMGMTTGALKVVAGTTVFVIGLAFAFGSDGFGYGEALNYVGYSATMLAKVVDLCNAGFYGKQTLQENSMLKAGLATALEEKGTLLEENNELKTSHLKSA